MKHFYLNKTGLDTLWAKIMANLGNAANYLKSELSKLDKTLTAAIAKETKDREEADKNLKAELTKDAEDKYLPLKGGGTIINDDSDNSSTKDYKLNITNSGFEIKDSNNDTRMIITPNEFTRYSTLNSLISIRDTGIVIQPKTGNFGEKDRIQLTGNKGYFGKIVINGRTDMNYSEYETPCIDIAHPTFGSGLIVSHKGIKYIGTDIGYIAKPIEDKRLFNRAGTYKEIGVDIAPLKDGTVPLDNLPPLDYVPNNKASELRTAESIYRITDNGLVLTKDENASVGTTGNYVNIKTPSTNGGGVIEISNKQTNGDSSWTSYNKMYSGYIYINTTLADKELNTKIDSGRLSVTTNPDPNDSTTQRGIHLITENATLLQLENSTDTAKLYPNGIDFGKRNYVVGANKDFYEVGTSANCLLKLDENGEIPTDVAGGYVPLKKESEILLGNTWYYSFGASGEFKVAKKNNFTHVSIQYDSIKLFDGHGNVALTAGYSKTNFNQPVEIANADGLTVYYNSSTSSSHTQIQGSNIYIRDNANDYTNIENSGITVCRNGSTLNGYLIGADGKYYQFDAANSVPQLDSDGKIKMSSLPSDVGKVLDVRVNNSSVVSNKIANIDLSSYATKSNLPTKTSQLTNDSGFLTSHQSLSGYATTSWVSSNFASSSHTHSYLPLSGGTITGSLHVNGNIESSADIIAYTSSDIRLKENIHEEDWIATIKDLGGVYAFTYKRSKKDSVGLIAQNLIDTKFEDLVTKDDEGYYKVNYMSSKLVSLALGGVSQVDDKVVELKQEVDDLKQEIAELKGIIEFLKQK